MICEYGCGKEATHQFKNGKWCCSKSHNSCPNIRKIVGNKNKKSHLGKKLSESHKQNIRIGNTGKIMSSSAKRKIGKANKIALKLTINQIFIKYPLFSKIEELRYKPNFENERIIQVRCKNHNCKNSKEQGGWFTPTYIQLYERIRQLENPEGNDGSYFYCSDDCKSECPFFRLRTDRLQFNNVKNYTSSEYQIWRQEVLIRANYKCEYCGEEANIAHHSRPQKLEPFHSLDPDFGIACCEQCHFKYGHHDECSQYSLSIKQCGD